MSQPLVLIQARTNSTRLYNKINQLIGHKRMIDHVRDRVRSTGLKYMLARPEDWSDEVVEEDVLGRFHLMLTAIDPEETFYDPIVRITADCPMLDSGLVLRVLAWYQACDPAYDIVHTSPAWDGLDVEVFSREVLARAHHAAVEEDEREHVTRWIKRYGRSYEIPLEGVSPLRWSVDDEDGLNFVRRVFEECALCADGVEHHTNAGSSISGSDRQPRWDLHMLPAGDLGECRAYDTLMSRTGGIPYVSR